MTERPVLRAVLDTNVVVAALRTRNSQSPTLELLERWVRSEFTWLYCDELEAEYQEKIEIPVISVEKRLTFLRRLRFLGERIELTPDQIQPIITADPDDDIVLACAVVGQATHLVTYDPHLLNLESSYQDVAIVDGLHFLYAVRGDQLPE